MSVAQSLIRSARFRAEREPDWRRLEQIVTKTERRGLRSLSLDEAQALATLYRQAMASLSVAREISLDRALLAYLEALCARAYLAVYAPQRRLRGLFSHLLVYGIPGAARRLFPLILVGYLILTLGGVAGYLLFQDDPTWYNTLVPTSPDDPRGLNSSAAELRSVIYDGADSEGGELSAFAAFLFSHNTRIALLVFCLGIAVCVPSSLLTFYNGMAIGAFVALHESKGLLLDITAWLSIHGVTELSAIAIACGGGLHLGQAVLFPGELRRRDALRRNARDAVKLALLAALMLIAAALLEGFGRQLVQDIPARLTIGLSVGAFWIAWLTLCGRGEAP